MFGKSGTVGLEFSEEKLLSKILLVEHLAVFKRSEDLFLITSLKNGMWTRFD